MVNVVDHETVTVMARRAGESGQSKALRKMLLAFAILAALFFRFPHSATKIRFARYHSSGISLG